MNDTPRERVPKVSYKVAIHQKAVNVLKKLDPKIESEVKEQLKALQETPEGGKHLKYCDFWSLRIGDYRAIYEIDEEKKTVFVYFIGHRKNVYTDFKRVFI